MGEATFIIPYHIPCECVCVKSVPEKSRLQLAVLKSHTYHRDSPASHLEQPRTRGVYCAIPSPHVPTQTLSAISGSQAGWQRKSYCLEGQSFVDSGI